MTIDPVCDMKVNKAVALQYTYKGKTYYFCAPICKTMFERDPEKYIRAEQDEVEAKNSEE